MATGMKNAKSQMISTRVPHELVEGIEAVRHNGESMPSFVIAAFRNEIARRKLGETSEDALISALNALARVKEIGSKAGEEINALISAAEDGLSQRKQLSQLEPAKEEEPEPTAPLVEESLGHRIRRSKF
ncbi:YlcI/YnfO family protein [Buttiauxella sp. 3AFRM03]|uniref:YlcI/YnfO family protein n=1 Tax=Buttiauxella sp. 3AFRM03 TaxID=2479367 RepID=UPI00192E5689|nr:YlcI/YnfO family protein [Buttiauxella sp. 3AFRM03]